MEKKSNEIWKIGFIVSIIVIIILVTYIIIKYLDNQSENKETAKSTLTSGSSDESGFRDITINEDLFTDGTIENLENVRWSNARIMQRDNKMEVSIMLNNESKEEKIPARTLTINLLNKNGKKIATKDVEMKEIDANYGYTDLDLEFDIEDVEIIYDIQIVAK